MPGPLTLYLILSIYLYLYLLLFNDAYCPLTAFCYAPYVTFLLAETNDADPSTRSFSSRVTLGARVT
jgi:hypothetical protein